MARFILEVAARRAAGTLAVCLAALNGCGAGEHSKPAGSGGGAPMLALVADPRWPACEPGAKFETVTFVHVNDIHGSYQFTPPNPSPVARLRGFYEQIKRENPYTVFTNAGDDYEKGSVAEQLSRGASSREVVQAMKFDVRTLGNHDFAWSVDEVLQNTHDPFARVLASNVGYTGNDPRGFAAEKFLVLNVGCARIGFFGLVSGPWDERDNPLATDFYPEMPTDADYARVAGAIVAAHRKEVDLLVAINHLGIVADMKLAAAVPGIDVILGGHSHSLTAEAGVVGKTLIVQAGAWGKNAARLDLIVGRRGVVANVFRILAPPFTADAEPSAAVQASVAAIMQRYAPDANATVARTAATLPEHAVAALVATGAIQVLAADAAIVDDSTVWNPLRFGPVTREDFVSSCKVERQPPGSPGFSSFYTVSIPASDLLKAASAINAKAGWTYRGPSIVDMAKTYKLALQKRTAFHPDMYIAQGLTMSPPQEECEAWEILDRYARDRTKKGLYLDVDEALDGCP